MVTNYADTRMHKRYFETDWIKISVSSPDELYVLNSSSYLITLLSHEQIGGVIEEPSLR